MSNVTIREFNIYGPVERDNHYYVTRDELLNDIFEDILLGKYFTIYAPRQTGKTTLMRTLRKQLFNRADIIPVVMDFQRFQDWEVDKFFTRFCQMVCKRIIRSLPTHQTIPSNLTLNWDDVNALLQNPPTDYDTFWEFFTELYDVWPSCKVVLVIDEFDGIPQRAITGLLNTWRSMYLDEDAEHALHSVVLIGIANVANLNLGRSSPFNIARQVNLPGFSHQEVKGLFAQYTQETKQRVRVEAIKKIFDLTSGQPFLVNRMANILTQELVTEPSQTIQLHHVQKAYRQFIKESNYNFETILRRAGEHPEEVFQILFGKAYAFNLNNKVVNKLFESGVISKTAREQCQISNGIYRQVLWAGFTPIQNRTQADMLLNGYNLSPDIGHVPNTKFDMRTILSRFRQFVERRGRQAFEISPTPQEATGQYLLMAYLDAISDRLGASVFAEVPTGDGRMDIVFAHGHERYVIETKIWRGEALYEDGLEQLQEYMVSEGVKTGYYVVFHNRPNVYGEFTQADLEYTETRNGFTIHTYIVRLGAIFEQNE